MARDIDYAATAVEAAILDKFGRTSEVADLRVTASDRTILVQQDERIAEGTRDELLAAVRASDTYATLWETLSKQYQPSRRSED